MSLNNIFLVGIVGILIAHRIRSSIIKSKNEKRMNTNFHPKGTLSLVGAGPGDASLLTIAAVNELKLADLIIMDFFPFFYIDKALDVK